MRIVVLRLVIDAAVIRDDRGREHLLHLRLRVWAVRAEAVQQGDVLAPRARAFEIREQPRDEQVIRCRSRDVRVDDDDLFSRDLRAQRCRAHRRIECRDHRRAFIREPGLMRRLDDRRAVIGEFDIEVAASVCECDFHAVDDLGSVRNGIKSHAAFHVPQPFPDAALPSGAAFARRFGAR